jgi:hypothetical protein
MVREALRVLGTQIPVVDVCDSEMPQFNTDDQRLSDTGTIFFHTTLCHRCQRPKKESGNSQLQCDII